MRGYTVSLGSEGGGGGGGVIGMFLTEGCQGYHALTNRCTQTACIGFSSVDTQYWIFCEIATHSKCL